MPATRTIDVRYLRNVHDITMSNLPTRYYGEANLHGDTMPAGVWTDHSDRGVQDIVYRLRNLQGDDRLTHEEITSVLGLRHWRDSYNAARNIGRRRDGDNGRNTAGELTWRRWNRQRNMRHTPAVAARPGARPDGSLVARRFGIEIEFNRGTGNSYDQQANILRDCTAAGIRCQQESYNHTTRPHWKMTTDATVTGGEFVSPIMAGDTASLDEVRDVIRIVRNNGGESTSTVGMHVHHDVTDFDTADMRVLLVEMLEACEHAMSRFVLADRINGGISCGALLMRSGEWAQVRTFVRNIVPGSAANVSNHEYGGVDRYRFFNIGTPMRKYGTVEFRGLGATLHAGKVRVWVRVGQAIIEAARQGRRMPNGVSPTDMVNNLHQWGLLGRQTADKFIAECTRRYPA